MGLMRTADDRDAGSAIGPPEIRCGILPAVAVNAWDRWVTGSPVGHMHQCYWWAAPLRAYGMSPEVIAAWSGDVLLGGALFRSTKVPGVRARIAESLDGPAFERWQAQYATAYSRAIADFARTSNALAVIIRGCPDPNIHRDLVEALSRLQGDVVLSPGLSEAILPLDGQTSETLWNGFSHDARKNIKRARANAVQVVRLESPDGFRDAYATWMATARRKGFESVRPWEALEPVLRHSVSSGAGIVFGATVDGNMIAAVFVTYVGRAAVYVYGGHHDGAERYSAARLLQLAAIEEAVARGLSEYSFGTLPAHEDPAKSGIDHFKLSFGAVPRQALDTITWRRHVLLYEGLTRVRGHPVGARIEQAIRRAVVSRGSGHDTDAT